MELEQRMADPQFYKDEVAFAESSKEYKSIERKLERQYRKWEEAQDEIERIESEFSDQQYPVQ
jgi:protein subunit release factor A